MKPAKPFRKELLALLAVFAVVLVACPGPTPEEEEEQETTLTVASSNFGRELLDPAADVQFAQITSAMFESPFTIEADGTVAPGIVTEWEASPDGAAWTLTMRDDVVFHDGTPVTTEDLAYAYQRAVADTTDEQDTWTEILGEEPNIETVDDTHIVVHTNGPQPLFIPLSTQYGSAIYLVPKANIEENGIDSFMEHPIGTGPYEFVKHVSGTEIEFKAVDYDHWRINPEFTSVRVVLTPEPATAVSQLSAGELDMAAVRLEDANALRNEDFQIVTGPPQQVYFPIVGSMAPANQGHPLSDVQVRRALSLAINRQELIDTLFPNFGLIPGPIRVGLDHMPDITDALREKWKGWAEENYRYDPGEAERLLAEAGYPNGFTFSFWIVRETSAPYLPDIAQAVAGYWKEIGVNAEIKNVSADAYERKRTASQPGAAFGVMATKAGSLAKASAGENVASNFISSGSDAALTGSPDEARMDQAWQEYLTSFDPAQQESSLDTIITIAAESWAQIPIVEVPDLFAFGPRVGPLEGINTFNVGAEYADWTVAG